MIERIEINLLPAEYRVHKRALQVQREIVWGMLILIVIALGLSWKTMMMDSKIAQFKTNIRTTEESIERNKPIRDEITRLKDSKTIVQGKIVALERINVDRGKWVRLMEILCQCLPDFTWITSCQEKDMSLVIEGKTFSFPEVANFMSRLSESNNIQGVDLSSIEEKDGTKAFYFSITCRLKQYVHFQQ
jgi:Tfp pilus assembly protein PilN